jgi:1-acyl-sn-glycerol-3-phosphate acyltransferase
LKPYAGLVNWVISSFFKIVCRVDITDLKNVPMQGPLILALNHVNSLEVPIVRPSLHPREVIGLTKKENYDSKFFKFLFEVWGTIPIERDSVDRAAVQACLKVLSERKILAVAPEGTRSGDGCLQPGKPGIVLLAVSSGAPILPAAFWGGENFQDDWKHLRRPHFQLRVGKPFLVDTHREGMSKDVRQRITDEIMFKLAELLPDQYQGAYCHPEREKYQYLKNVSDTME